MQVIEAWQEVTPLHTFCGPINSGANLIQHLNWNESDLRHGLWFVLTKNGQCGKLNPSLHLKPCFVSTNGKPHFACVYVSSANQCQALFSKSISLLGRKKQTAAASSTAESSHAWESALCFAWAGCDQWAVPFRFRVFTKEKVCQQDRGERSRSAPLQNKWQQAFIKASARLCLLTAARSLHQAHSQCDATCDSRRRLFKWTLKREKEREGEKKQGEGKAAAMVWRERLKRFRRLAREHMLCVCMMEAVSKHLGLLHHNSIWRLRLIARCAAQLIHLKGVQVHLLRLLWWVRK